MTSQFTIHVSGTFTRDEIPPRCRKPRPVTHDTSTTTTVQAVTSDEAPVAFRITDTLSETVADIRTHNGQLYTPFLPVAHQKEYTKPGDDIFPSELDENHHLSGYQLRASTSAEDFDVTVQNIFSRFLIIDDAIWKLTSEPAYHVMTFGLGGINGSTGLSVSTRRDVGMIFRADEYEAARACAIATARDRGDDASRFEADPERYRSIEVLIPEAVTLVTMPPTPNHVKRLRLDYNSVRSRLRDAYTPYDEAEAFSELIRLREAIIETGHTPVESDLRPYEARHHQEG